MRIVRGHAGHAMAKKRLPDFGIHTNTLQSGCERMPQVLPALELGGIVADESQFLGLCDSGLFFQRLAARHASRGFCPISHSARPHSESD